MRNDRLKELRVNKGWSQDAAAEVLGVSRTTYAGYEQGYRKPDTDMLNKIADVFNVNSDYLLGRSDHPEMSQEEEDKVSTENLKKIRDLISKGKVTLDDGTPMTEAQINHIVQTLDLHLQTKENK